MKKKGSDFVKVERSYDNLVFTDQNGEKFYMGMITVGMMLKPLVFHVEVHRKRKHLIL